ncbi:helix-turn-helix domain-containing protein [Paraburkholderia sp. 32]|uniref:helix-turn-helix domain-containing protein n=1 Tax=Paraburkholderia sp. 32 TaxID=2991057 RepID=UPI003D1F09E6
MPETLLLAKEKLARSVSMTRKEKKISGDALCQRANIGRNTLYLIEKKSGNARLDTIMNLAVALNVDPCHFFGRDRYSSPSKERIQTFRASVAAKIQGHRTMRALSQNALTKRAGLPWGYVSQIERKSPDLTLDVLDKIAGALNVEVVELLAPDFADELGPIIAAPPNDG